MTVTTTPLRIHFTVDDLERMPYVEGARYELIDGELYVSTASHVNHQITCRSLTVALTEWGRVASLGQAVFGAGLLFDQENNVIPDVVWVRQSRVAQVFGADGKLHGAPDIVAEVLSPGTINTARDRELKLGLYSRQGVLEYWIADWRQRQVDVYRQGENGLVLVATLEAADALTSPILPGFSLPLPQLFGDLIT